MFIKIHLKDIGTKWTGNPYAPLLTGLKHSLSKDESSRNGTTHFGLRMKDGAMTYAKTYMSCTSLYRRSIADLVLE